MAHVNSGQFVVIDKRDMIIAIWEKLFRVAKGNYMSKFMNFDFPNIMFNIVWIQADDSPLNYIDLAMVSFAL